LELGGKSPCVVDASADVEFAAMKVAALSFMNSGQLCIRPDYILV
jgi:acyl-CoA reductase-like NAD-dependent aldehyde dehydrogenase